MQVRLVTGTSLAALLLWGSAAAAPPPAPAAAAPLRVCADPDYMPYSNRAGQGFENKIAQVVGRTLGRPVVYVWKSTRGDTGFEEMVHQYLNRGRCDLIVDVPYAVPDLLTTKPYYISSYVFVYKKGKGYDDITSLDSPALRHVKIGFEADTPVEDGLKLRTLIVGAKPFLSADEEDANPSDIIDAVQNGTINVGLTWDPAVGYYIGQHPDLTAVIIPNARSQGSPEQYTFPMAMATRDGNTSLVAQLNRVIAQDSSQLDAILTSYHITYFKPNGNG
ncbi:MAG TPA: transporter substrate-binding domain-containing protein [Candidatus Acidoferrales bacterium]|nr:transporter substrate-binding domain-containing protein [Candidatus Acidoferrales bacterium]